MRNPIQYLTHSLGSHSGEYKKVVIKTYMKALFTIVSKAKIILLKGIYYSFSDKIKQHHALLEGSVLWGQDIVKMTKSNVVKVNEINVPETGHMVFINHVNELDFPFDCLIVKKPFLANQQIKHAYFAYWWMKAMGSLVFDTTHARTIATSVRELTKGLKYHSYIVYPEGHNTYSEEIKPLKKGMIKVAFDSKIPLFIILKSGITQFQKHPNGNKIGYKHVGTVDPSGFESWETLKDHIHDLMVKGKAELDKEILTK